MPNSYIFERRVIYWEQETVYADSVQEAWEKVGNGNADEIELQDFYDYYDEGYELVDERIDDPFVNMIIEYDKFRQLDLFE